MQELSNSFKDDAKLVDLNWESFCYLIKSKYQEDLEGFM